MKTKLYPITKFMPEDYEKWLESYEARGWHLESISFLGLFHHFKKSNPAKYRYFYDYQSKHDKDYKSIFSDLGWELINQSCHFYVWRHQYTEERPQAFSDSASLISHNNKLIGSYICCLVPFFICFFEYSRSTFPSLFRIIIFLLLSIFCAYTLLIIIRLLLVNRKLKRNTNQN